MATFHHFADLKSGISLHQMKKVIQASTTLGAIRRRSSYGPMLVQDPNCLSKIIYSGIHNSCILVCTFPNSYLDGNYQLASRMKVEPESHLNPHLNQFINTIHSIWFYLTTFIHLAKSIITFHIYLFSAVD